MMSVDRRARSRPRRGASSPRRPRRASARPVRSRASVCSNTLPPQRGAAPRRATRRRRRPRRCAASAAGQSNGASTRGVEPRRASRDRRASVRGGVAAERKGASEVHGRSAGCEGPRGREAVSATMLRAAAAICRIAPRRASRYTLRAEHSLMPAGAPLRASSRRGAAARCGGRPVRRAIAAVGRVRACCMLLLAVRFVVLPHVES